MPRYLLPKPEARESLLNQSSSEERWREQAGFSGRNQDECGLGAKNPIAGVLSVDRSRSGR
jgi:hypothetical protein